MQLLSLGLDGWKVIHLTQRFALQIDGIPIICFAVHEPMILHVFSLLQTEVLSSNNFLTGDLVKSFCKLVTVHIRYHFSLLALCLLLFFSSYSGPCSHISLCYPQAHTWLIFACLFFLFQMKKEKILWFVLSNFFKFVYIRKKNRFSLPCQKTEKKMQRREVQNRQHGGHTRKEA